MTKNIEFTPLIIPLPCYRNFEDDPKEELPLYWWLHKNLDEGCLEDRLKKVSSLVALIGAEWLATHPDSAGEAAYAIGCNGRYHKVVDER